MKAQIILVLTSLWTSLAYAGLPPNEVKDEGTSQGLGISVFNCVGAGIACTTSGRTGTITVGGGGAGNSFETIDVPAGTDPVADSSTDTLLITETSPLVITGTAATDTIDITWSGTDIDSAGAVTANSVALGTDTTGGYAGSSTEGGAATTATALAANGANCSAGNYPLGVDASGAVESCTADATDTNAVKEYWWPASATLPLEVAADSIPPISKLSGTNIDQLTVDFDSATDECRTVSFKVPSDVAGGSTITFRIHWSSTATSGNVIWDFRDNGGVAEGATPDATLTTNSAAADAVQGTAGQITVTTWTQTLSSLGWTANEQVDAEFCRDANNGSDTLAADARATGFGVEIPRA